MKLKHHRLKPGGVWCVFTRGHPCAQVFTVPTECITDKWSFYWCFERQRRWHGGCRRLVQSAKGDEPPYNTVLAPSIAARGNFPGHPLAPPLENLSSKV